MSQIPENSNPRGGISTRFCATLNASIETRTTGTWQTWDDKIRVSRRPCRDRSPGSNTPTHHLEWLIPSKLGCSKGPAATLGRPLDKGNRGLHSKGEGVGGLHLCY